MAGKSSSGIQVAKGFAQKTIWLLDESGWRLKQLKPKAGRKYVIIPVKKLSRKEKEKLKLELSQRKIAFKRVSSVFLKQPKKTQSLKQALSKKLTQKELESAITSYNILGDIAVIEVPPGLRKKEKVIAQALLETNKRLKTVLKKSGKTTGRYRVHPVKLLAGKAKTQALYRENNCQFKINLDKVFFSPRLARERLRIAKQIKKNEVVAGLFAGVGPFPIVFARNSGMAKAFAVELNPFAFQQLKENIILNRVEDKVEAIYGDVKKIVPKKLKGKCDRAVMPLPKGGETFLREAIQCLKPEGGIIHFYQFVPVEKPFAKALKLIEKAAKQEKRKVKILRKSRVRSFSPKIIQVVVDFKVK